jgi:hypothetical protein
MASFKIEIVSGKPPLVPGGSLIPYLRFSNQQRTSVDRIYEGIFFLIKIKIWK